MIRNLTFALLLAALVTAAGCGGDSGTPDTQGKTDATAIDGQPDQATTPGMDAPAEAGPSNCGCAIDELCVIFYDGTCRSFGSTCKKGLLNCRGSLSLECDQAICGWGADGGQSMFTHRGPPCPNEPAGSYGCYGS